LLLKIIGLNELNGKFSLLGQLSSISHIYIHSWWPEDPPSPTTKLPVTSIGIPWKGTWTPIGCTISTLPMDIYRFEEDQKRDVGEA
jgi:hypothetical protein